VQCLPQDRLAIRYIAIYPAYPPHPRPGVRFLSTKKVPKKHFRDFNKNLFVLVTHRFKLLFAFVLGDFFAAFLFEVAHNRTLSLLLVYKV
jgi:hypothetical protein